MVAGELQVIGVREKCGMVAGLGPNTRICATEQCCPPTMTKRATYGEGSPYNSAELLEKNSLNCANLLNSHSSTKSDSLRPLGGLAGGQRKRKNIAPGARNAKPLAEVRTIIQMHPQTRSN